MEKIFHSFAEKSTADCFGVSQNQYYLWVAHFYWICDSKAVQEVVGYTVIRDGTNIGSINTQISFHSNTHK